MHPVPTVEIGELQVAEPHGAPVIGHTAGEDPANLLWALARTGDK